MNAETKPPNMRIERFWPTIEWARIWMNLWTVPVTDLTKTVWYKIINDIVPTKERLHKIRIAPTENCRLCGRRTPYSTDLRNVAMVDINGNGHRKDSRSCYKLIQDGYRKNGYSGHCSANVLYCGFWRNLWGLDLSFSGT